MSVSFGAADSRTIRFLKSCKQFFIGEPVSESATNVQAFIQTEYLEKGAALFGRETPESLDDFRQSAHGELDGMTDSEVYSTLQYSVQRLRNYSHLQQLMLAAFDHAEIVRYGKCGDVCQPFAGKLISVPVALDAITKLTALSAIEQGRLLRENTIAARSSEWILNATRKRIIEDRFVCEALLIPPFWPDCKCSLEGFFPELEK